MARPMSEFVIEKGIPPARRANAAPDYPFSEMDIGDSFIAPPITKRILSNAAGRYKRKHKATGWDFICRTTADGCRIWRTR